MVVLFNARGTKIQVGKVYRNIINHELVVIRKARNDYTCETCYASIYWGNFYAKPAAKFATNKYCLDCIGKE